MSERISDTELLALERMSANPQIRRLVAEVRRLRAIIIGSRSDLHREAKAINEEQGFKK
jgi:radical SAM superfamily enzyme YgiQ (UPF0313 family)